MAFSVACGIDPGTGTYSVAGSRAHLAGREKRQRGLTIPSGHGRLAASLGSACAPKIGCDDEDLRNW